MFINSETNGLCPDPPVTPLTQKSNMHFTSLVPVSHPVCSDTPFSLPISDNWGVSLPESNAEISSVTLGLTESTSEEFLDFTCDEDENMEDFLDWESNWQAESTYFLFLTLKLPDDDLNEGLERSPLLTVNSLLQAEDGLDRGDLDTTSKRQASTIDQAGRQYEGNLPTETEGQGEKSKKKEREGGWADAQFLVTTKTEQGIENEKENDSRGVDLNLEEIKAYLINTAEAKKKMQNQLVRAFPFWH